MAENNARFTVRGVDSEDDIREIKDGLSEIDGVMGADIDQETGEMTVKYDYDVIAEERIEISVRELGYEVE